MEKITLTCPFTGVEFDAIKTADGVLFVQNPLTGEKIRIGANYASRKYLVDMRAFEHIETVNNVEAAKLLGVSRARISAIVKHDAIPHYTINGQNVFLKSDITSYSENRKVGRPKDE